LRWTSARRCPPTSRRRWRARPSGEPRLCAMARRKESRGDIDWAAAEVADGTLTVPLTGEPSKAWAERVAEVVERLGGGRGWGETDITRKAITVRDVRAGAEVDVRHF